MFLAFFQNFDAFEALLLNPLPPYAANFRLALRTIYPYPRYKIL